MLSEQDLAENAPYRLPDHGRVRVLLIEDDAVTYERPDETLTNSQFTPMHTIPKQQFRQTAEPLPISVDLPSTDATADSNLGGA